MGDGEANIKQFLHSWLGTNKYGTPSYEVRPTGPGNSTSKKDAHANAAQDFCAYLVRTGKLQEDQVPSHGSGGVAPGRGASALGAGGPPGGGGPHLGLTPAPVFR